MSATEGDRVAAKLPNLSDVRIKILSERFCLCQCPRVGLTHWLVHMILISFDDISFPYHYINSSEPKAVTGD